MKCLIKSAFVALAFAAVGCDSGSTSDPATASRSDLNPPSGLTTVTWDDRIELRWKGANAEAEFKGYDVFVKATTVSALGTVGYPKPATGTVSLADGSVPRCKDNTAVFEAMGFPKTDKDCEGGDESGATGTDTGSTLMATDDAAAEKLTNIAHCEESTGTDVSLVSAVPTLGDVTCTIKKLADGTALATGTTYTFVVMAVAKDDFSLLSWTSNFVQDTPAVKIFDGDLTVKATEVYTFPVANLTGFTAVTAAPTGAACDASVCSINQTNSKPTDGIYIGRLGTGSYPQRTFVSVPTGGAIALQLRGPQVFDDDGKTLTKSKPGDQATPTGSYLADGKLYPIYGLQVFDMEVTVGSAKHYGKIWFGQPTFAANADGKGDMTLPMKIVMNSKAGSYDYLVKPELH